MRKYKAVVVDLKKTAKTVIVAALGVVVTAITFNIIKSENIAGGRSEAVLRNSSAIISAAQSNSGNAWDCIRKGGKIVSKIFLGYVAGEAKSVLSGAVPVYYHVCKKGELIVSAEEGVRNISEKYFDEDKYLEEENVNNEALIPEESKAGIKNINVAQKPAGGCPVAIGNETSYGIDIRSMLSQKPDIDMSKPGPKVLITHTHATEAYSDDNAEVYDMRASDRSSDTSKNVVAVGDRLEGVFKEHGIEVLHDTVLHDEPSFNGSYAHSLSTVEEYLKKYPSIQIVFDIHRDSIVYDDNTKARTVTIVGGKKSAQLMFVVGTDEKGLYNPEWRENLKTAIHFQTAITQRYPNLMRHINLRKERFNGHTTHSSMIIEVGTSGNSLNEAINGIEAAGNCISDYLNSL